MRPVGSGQAESVSDNAFTNVVARWNLQAAANMVRSDGHGGTASEATAWMRIADALVDGYDPETKLYEQFAGFFQLEPLIVSEITDPPIAADLLLGRERVTGAQIVKQADVLMLHHIIPDMIEKGSLAPNLDFYGPRTAHGSSLSPAIHASLLARAGRPDEALDMLRIAASIDLDDLTGTTAGGLHLATMGAYGRHSPSALPASATTMEYFASIHIFHKRGRNSSSGCASEGLGHVFELVMRRSRLRPTGHSRCRSPKGGARLLAGPVHDSRAETALLKR